MAQVQENFRNNISQENFLQTFFDAFTKIHQEKAAYFDLLLSSAHRMRFVEKIMAEVLPIFKEKFHLPPEDIHADFLARIYLQTVISAIGNWIDDGRKLPLKDLSKILGKADKRSND